MQIFGVLSLCCSPFLFIFVNCSFFSFLDSQFHFNSSSVDKVTNCPSYPRIWVEGDHGMQIFHV